MSAFLDSIGLSDMVMFSTLADGSLEDWLAGVYAFYDDAPHPSKSIAEMRPALVRMYTVVRARCFRFYAAEAGRFIAATAICEQLASPGSSGVAAYRPSVARALRAESRGQVHIALVPKLPTVFRRWGKALQQRRLVRLDAIRARAQLTKPVRAACPGDRGLGCTLVVVRGAVRGAHLQVTYVLSSDWSAICYQPQLDP